MKSAEVEFLYDTLSPILERNADESPARISAAISENPTPPEFTRYEGAGEELEYISLCNNNEEDGVPSLLLATTDSLDQSFQGTPWCQPGSKTFRSPLLQLHQEILDFCKFISPTEDEKLERTAAVQRVCDCITFLWPNSQVKVFGSFATGLYLPSSDVDMVILESGVSAVSGLNALSRVIRKRSLCRNIFVVANARVPIVKFVESSSGISFDISFDLTNGPEAAKFIQQALATIPPLRPLCMVLKFFLQQRKLNEVYLGGIGSYALLVMLLTHLQLHPSRHSLSPLETNLGVLLVDFLELYGLTLNVNQVGISCADGGRFYSKASRGFYNKGRPFLLSVEDPQAPENDIGKNSYCILKVRAAFALAHKILTTSDASGGMLGRIIRNDEKLKSRKQEDVSAGYFFIKEDSQKEVIVLKNEVPPSKGQRRNKNKYPSHENDRKRKRFNQEGNDSSTEPRQRHRPEKRKMDKNKVNKAASSSRQKSKWRKVEDSPSPKPAARTTYTDHYDHGRTDSNNKRVFVTSASHKKIKYS